MACLLASGNLLGSVSSALAHHGVRLWATETSTPLATVFLKLLIVVGLDGRNQASQLRLVSILDLSEGYSSSSLLVDKSTKSGLALDNAVGDIHLAAKSRQVKNKFNGINVVSDDNELSLLGFDQGNNVVQAILDNDGLLGLDLLSLSLGSSSSA